jgi:hypothetical protein
MVERKILNPDTGRYVTRRGVIGQALLKKRKGKVYKSVSFNKIKYVSRKSPVRKSPVRKSPVRKSSVRKSPVRKSSVRKNRASPQPRSSPNLRKNESKDRKSPRESATSRIKGALMEGVDGNMWEVVTNKNGVKRWKKF